MLSSCKYTHMHVVVCSYRVLLIFHHSSFILLVDVDECTSRNGGCSHGCINAHGSYECICPRGYRVQEDLKTCAGRYYTHMLHSFTALVDCAIKRLYFNIINCKPILQTMLRNKQRCMILKLIGLFWLRTRKLYALRFDSFIISI